MVKMDTKFKTEIGAVTGDIAAVTVSINNAVVIHEVDIDMGPAPRPAAWMSRVGALAVADMLINGPSVTDEKDETDAPARSDLNDDDDGGVDPDGAGNEPDDGVDETVPAATDPEPERESAEAGAEAGGDDEPDTNEDDSDSDVSDSAPVKAAPPKAKKKPAKK